MDAQTITTLRCTACGALADAKCACGVSYEPLSAAQRVERRREKAGELYGRGVTMQEIANQLKVSRSVIGEDLGNLPETDKLKHHKTATNPKGGGRPKGSKTKRPGVKQAQRSVDAHPDDWQMFKDKAEALGKSAAEALGELLAEPEIDPKTLPKTTQEKLAIALRHQKRVQDAEFERRVQAEYTARVKKNFPDLDKMQRAAAEEKRTYERLSRERKHIMSVTDFMFVLSCLHPDSRASVSEGRLKRAFQMLEPKKFAITGEK